MLQDMSYQSLVKELIKSGYLCTPRIIEAFKAVDRKDFVPADLADQAYVNAPLPIGFGQTISQPLTVAFMIELLTPGPGERILDIGSGSGWQTALLAKIVGETGAVYAIERIGELREFGEQNVAKYGFRNVWFFTADGSRGLPEFAPYDQIIAAASAPELPPAWKKQVKIGGRIVAPIGASVWKFEHKKKQFWVAEESPGFAFVPLVKQR